MPAVLQQMEPFVLKTHHCLRLVVVQLLLFRLISHNWQEPSISKACDLTVARFTKETNGYGEVLFPNIIWPFYWLQKVVWGSLAYDCPQRLLELSQGNGSVILSSGASLAFYHQLQSCCRVSAYCKAVKKWDTGLHFTGSVFHNTVLISKMIVPRPLHKQTGDEHNRDDKRLCLWSQLWV